MAVLGVADKQVVREKFLKVRDQHSLSEKRAADSNINQRMLKLLSDLNANSNAKSVLAYRPLKSEADPFLGEVSTEYFYPRVVGKNLQAFQVAAPDDFEKSEFGVLEPLEERAKPVAIKDLDVVLVPGVAFDRQGNRLGFGKGFYDRFLKSSAACRVGIAYSFQVSPESLPSDEWDERVDWIVTERFVLHVERKDRT